MADPMTVSGLRHWRRLRQRRKRWWRWRRRAGAAVTAPHPGSSGTGRICALAHPSREPGRMCVWQGWAVRGRESRPAPRAQSGWQYEKRPLLPGPWRVSKPVGCASTSGLLARAPHSLPPACVDERTVGLCPTFACKASIDPFHPPPCAGFGFKARNPSRHNRIHDLGRPRRQLPRCATTTGHDPPSTDSSPCIVPDPFVGFRKPPFTESSP